MTEKELKALVGEAIDNIRNDRKVTREFLNEIANIIANDPTTNRSLSVVAAKHIETLQRSNEQLVKIVAIHKKKMEQTKELSDDDKDQLFDMIQESANNAS